MMFTEALVQGFVDELEKLGVCSPMTKHPQGRKGRRPIRVDTLLKRERELTSALEQVRKDLDSPGPTTDAVSRSQRRAKRVSR